MITTSTTLTTLSAPLCDRTTGEDYTVKRIKYVNKHLLALESSTWMSSGKLKVQPDGDKRQTSKLVNPDDVKKLADKRAS